MKARIIYLIMIAFLSYSPLEAQSELDPYLLEAGKNNPQLMGMFNEYLAALEKITQVNKLPDPQLVLAYFLSPVETRMGPQRFKISASQFFPWFGSLDAAESIATKEAKSKLEAFEEAKSLLFHEVRSSYYSLYLTNKAILITAENIEILESFKRLVMIRIENGQASSIDDIRLTIELGDMENQLALYQDQLLVQWNAFDNLINSEVLARPAIPAEIVDIGLSIDKEDIWDAILKQNHQLLKLEMESLAIQAKKDLAGLSGKPNINLGIEYLAIGKGENNLPGTDGIVFPMIGINIPIYRDKYKARVQEMVYFEIAKNKEQEARTNFLDNLLEGVWKDYKDASRRIILFTSQSDLARKGLELLQTDFAAGETPFEEILRMERKLLSYSLQLEKARTDKAVALSYINYLIGK